MKKTLDLTPQAGEMLKPKELIELRGTGPLTLQDRRVYNLLIDHAWGPNLGTAGHWFTIDTAELRTATDRNARLDLSVTRLMQTVCVVSSEDGSEETKVQLLGATILKTTSNGGSLRYKIPEDLAALLEDSTIFAKLDLEVMRSFSSKYAFALYEAISRRIRMTRFMEEFSIEDMREVLGVEEGRLTTYRNLNVRAIQPAVTEVNSLSPYTVNIQPRYKGRKVVGFLMGWEAKDTAGKQEAYREMQRPRVGRKARLEGKAETPIVDDIDS